MTDRDVCNAKHEEIDRTLTRHERRMNNHGERIDSMERSQSRSDAIIENLCEQIKNLVLTIKWFTRVVITSMLGFVIWYLQNF